MKNSKSQKLGADMTVLKIISVSTSSSKQQEGPDLKAIEFLQTLGFIKLKYDAPTKRTIALPPEEDTLFLIVYDASITAKQKPFQLVCMQPRFCRWVESGYTIYIQDFKKTKNSIEVILRGDRLPDWSVICDVANTATVNVYNKHVAKGTVLGPKEISVGRETQEEYSGPPEDFPDYPIGEDDDIPIKKKPREIVKKNKVSTQAGVSAPVQITTPVLIQQVFDF